MKSFTVRKLAYTGVCLALLIAVQYITKPLGQLVTGSLVNLILITATLTAGPIGGGFVALISPFLAFLLGIGTPILPIVPMIALGNIVLVLVYSLTFHFFKGKPFAKWLLALVLGSVLKLAALYFGIVKLLLPMLTQLKPKQVQMLSASFGLPQLITALIGGVVAMAVVPPVLKAINAKKE